MPHRGDRPRWDSRGTECYAPSSKSRAVSVLVVYGEVAKLHHSSSLSTYVEGAFIRINTVLPITLAHWRGYPARLSQA